jgi:hypothetical protein
MFSIRLPKQLEALRFAIALPVPANATQSGETRRLPSTSWGRHATLQRLSGVIIALKSRQNLGEFLLANKLRMLFTGLVGENGR